MRGRDLWFGIITRWGLLLFTFGSVTGSAAMLSVNLPASNYGNLNQHDMSVYPTMACGPASVVNTLYYLQTANSALYGNSLVPNSSYAGLKSLGNTLAGASYMQTDSTNGTWHDTLMWETADYIESVSAGHTLYAAQDYWSWIHRTRPAWMTYQSPTWNFIYQSLVAGSGLEILLTYHAGGGHFVSVNGFSWNDIDTDGLIDSSENAYLNFINPWTGSSESTHIWQTVANGVIETDYSNSWVSSAFSLTAVPEPSAVLLFGLGLVIILWRLQRAAFERES